MKKTWSSFSEERKNEQELTNNDPADLFNFYPADTI